MNYTKRITALLLLLSILAGCMATGQYSIEAETISKETEWNIKCLNAENSYAESKNLPKIRVAVLDSGLDTDRNIPFVKRKDFLGNEELHFMFQDETGHGTSVAGLICATENNDRITGIAANADLYIARILDAQQKASIDRVIEALEWAMAEDVNIIHMSFGTKYYSEELEETIKKAYKQGILIIAAAGNDGNAAEDESTIEYPAAFDEVISVGATDVDNSVMESSSTGDELDVVAPGNQILSTGAFGGVVVKGGTTISAAQVTGIAAVLWGKHPDKSNDFIKHLLVGSANSEGVRGECGNGLVDYKQTNDNYKQMNASYKTYKKQGFTEKKAVMKAVEELPENNKPIKSYENEVHYVNGLWETEKHEEWVGNTKAISEKDLALVKAGTVVPDELDGVMAKMTIHPCFHGCGNYFANVSYLLGYAKQLIKDGKEELPKFEDVFIAEQAHKDLIAEKKNDIETQLKSSYNKFYESCASKTNNGALSTSQKGYAILGLALHTITDTFTHMAYRKEGGNSQNFYKIVHDQTGVKENSVTQLWHDIANSNTSNSTDKKYYQDKLDNYACADDVDKVKVGSILAEKVSKELVAALNGTDDFLNKMADILKKYKEENKDETNEMNKPQNYRIANVNTNWAAVKDNTNFDINIDVHETKIEKPKRKNITVKIKSKKLTIQFPHKKGYTYQVYYKKSDKKIFFTRNGEKYTTKTKGMENSNIYIVSFLGSEKATLKYKIQYEVTYVYKKKQKKQVIPFNPKKQSFKLYGNVFKIKKKKFKGWSKKKNAKKVTYKPKKKIKFTENGKLKLYCVK